MVSLSNSYPAGMRVSAGVAMALMDAGRYEEAENVTVSLLDPLNPDGSAPLDLNGQPEHSLIRGSQVKEKLGRGFRDADEVAKTVRFDVARFDELIAKTDTIERDGEVVTLVEVPEPKSRKKRTNA